jgi:hypothetical protein
MDSQLGEWRCCDVATGTPPSDSTRTTRTPTLWPCPAAAPPKTPQPSSLSVMSRCWPVVLLRNKGPDSPDGPWKNLLLLTALVALLSVSNETKAQVYDCNRRGCAALPAGQTVKREGGFNSQRKIVPMSNNQQSEKRKK